MDQIRSPIKMIFDRAHIQSIKSKRLYSSNIFIVQIKLFDLLEILTFTQHNMIFSIFISNIAVSVD